MDNGHMTWRKSSYSGANGGGCVEVGMWRTSSYTGGDGNCVEVGVWRTSNHSGGNGGDCVEVAATPANAVAVRDSKDREGPRLAFTPAAWAAFTRQIKDGRLHLA